MASLKPQRVRLLWWSCCFLLPFVLWQSLELSAAGHPWEESAFSGNSKAILAAAQSLVKDGTKETVVLLDERKIVLDAAGRAVETHRVVYKIGTEDPEEWSNVEAVWRPWRQERPVVRARTITGDGRDVELDKKTLAEAPLGEGGTDTFGDSRILRAPLPSISAGAVVETQIIVKDTAAIFDRGVATYIPVGHSVPVLQTLVVIEAPASLPLKHALAQLPDLSPARSTSGNKVVSTFQIGRLEGLDLLDIFLESPADPKIPYIAYSTGKSWNDVAAGFSRVVDTQIAQSNLAAVARETAGSATPREETVERLLQLVQKKIRYKAVELGDSAIVPTPPAETLRLEYGDCKDQAALLISLLRASGIEAHMALLSVSGFDANPELPGIGGFDHAIVYVPGSTPLWIDSTSGFSRAGQLPTPDQGRMALIVKPDTTVLVRTPELKSRSVETREAFLSEFGAGRIVETTEFFGAAELAQRSSVGQLKAEDFRENLEQYAKDAYAARTVDGIQHSDPADFAAPFRLRFEAKEAAVVQTTLNEAVVAIALAPLVDDIGFLLDRETKGSAQVNDASKEWRYRIVPPAGFQKQQIPESKTQRFGPATLSWEFSTAADGVVTGTLKFDTGKRKYSTEEVEEVKKRLKELDENSVLLVNFEQTGEAHLSAGRVKEALVEFRRLAQLHPNEAIHHTQIARAMLGGGLGEGARAEARRAVELEPDSVVAHQVLGITMEHNLAGGRFQKGWNREAAEAAYRRAIQLDPSNLVNLIDLGVLLEHDVDGQRYSPRANLDGAIEQYRLGISKAETAEEKTVLQDNLSVALLWAGRFREAREAAVRPEFRLAAAAALDGSDAAIRETGRLFQDARQRQAALLQTSAALIQIRRYALGADLLRAAAVGAPNASEILARVEQVSKLKRYEDFKLPENDPGTVLKQMMAGVLTDQSEEVLRSLVAKENQDSLSNEGGLRTVAQNLVAFAGGVPTNMGALFQDMLTSVTETTAEGDDTVGYRVTFRASGMPGGGRLFVVRQDGKYRMLTLDRFGEALAAEALRHADNGGNASARRLMNWARDEIRLNGADMLQVAGDAFFRRGLGAFDDPKMETQTIRSAAAMLLSTSPKNASVALGILNTSRNAAKPSREKEALDLAYAVALFTLGRYEESLRVGEALAAPNQDGSAKLIVFNSLMKLGRFADAKEALRRKPAKPPVGVTLEIRALFDDSQNPEMSRKLATIERMQGNFGAAEALLRQLVSNDKVVEINDVTNLAWLSLFRDKGTDEDVSTALRAVSLGFNRGSTSLYTLAALYAERGKTAEALQVIFQSMAADGNRGPAGNDWYVLGRIYEHLGESAAAASAYQKVEQSKVVPIDPATPFALAQRRLRALGK